MQVKEDELARRMGVDPDRDILIIPERIVAQYGVYHFPRWLKSSKYVQEAYIAVGARDKDWFKRKGEIKNEMMDSAEQIRELAAFLRGVSYQWDSSHWPDKYFLELAEAALEFMKRN